VRVRAGSVWSYCITRFTADGYRALGSQCAGDGVNERKAVFRDDRDRKDYLRRLAHDGEKFECRVLAYCLMDNHVHLAIETGKTPLSRIMAGLQSSSS
jgi:hypothetical protein